MRDIKFRAWNKEKNIMCYRNEDLDADYWDGVYASILEIINDNIKAKRYIFMQYTGLKYKNGKEIYEGDIVEVTKPCIYETGTIVFKNGCFFIKVKETLLALWECKPNNYELKAIGNIYENPELLEDK